MPPNRNTLAQRSKIPKFWPPKSYFGLKSPIMGHILPSIMVYLEACFSL